MERRHQVFISSTYSDLKAERSELIQALLELDCLPAGMELFPATTEAAWELIKEVIDDSDYYCLVIGGRYGSTDATGLSYTEREYDYAVSKGKPLMAFLHRDPGGIPAGKSESTDSGRERLDAFRKKVEAAHHCKYWSNAPELGGLVSRSLVNLRKAHPAEGWVRGKFAATPEMLLEIANLRTQVAELTAQKAELDSKAGLELPPNIAGGSDQFTAPLSYKLRGEKEHANRNVTVTWDNVLAYVGPALLNECSERELEEKLQLMYFHTIRRQTEDVEYASVVVPYVTFDAIKVQLRALGQMIPGLKRRAVSDTNSYWKLTESGEKRLIAIQAQPKPQAAVGLPSAAPEPPSPVAPPPAQPISNP